MHYRDNDWGFSFELPEGWQQDLKSVLILKFVGPNATHNSELILVQIGAILPEYVAPENREKFLAEAGAKLSRAKLGDELNVVVLRRQSDSEISAVRDGLQYNIAHSNDLETQDAVERMKKSFRFPSAKEVLASVRRRSSDPQYQAILRALQSGSAQEARNVLDAAGMPAVIERQGYTMHRVGVAAPNAGENDSRRRKRWWQFWQ
jgi:hypothetical protein